jgi:hypothetical protein
VVIGKIPAEHNFQPQFRQRIPKTLRIAEGAEGGNTLGGQLIHREALLAKPPLPGSGENTEHRSGFVEPSQLAADIAKAHVIVGASNEKRIGSFQCLEGFAQAAKRNGVAETEGQQPVDHNQIDIAMEAGVLETVVKQKCVGVVVLQEQLAGFGPVGADTHGADTGA